MMLPPIPLPPEKFHKLRAVLICSAVLLHELSWAWAWMRMSQPASRTPQRNVKVTKGRAPREQEMLIMFLMSDNSLKCLLRA